MKKYYSFVLFAITALSFFTANAQDAKSFPKWKVSSPNQQEVKSISKVSPNEDKVKGILMYATTLTDYFIERGWWSFKSADTYNATKIKTWVPGSKSYVNGLRCGSWGGDAYYGYYVKQYDLGFDHPDSFVKVNVATGDTTVITRFPEGHDFRDNWYKYLLYCMTYNPVDKVIYALGQTALEDRSVSSLYMIDKETGTPTKIKDFDFISFAFAVDMDGKLWIEAPILNDTEDQILGCKFYCMDTKNFIVEKELSLTVSGKSFKTHYYGTMSFDYTNGNLYWIASDEYYKQATYKVNTETGGMEKLGTPYWGGIYIGLYIPYTLPDAPEAPVAVTELTAEAAATGVLQCTLKWINPTLQWNKEELTKLSEILIYRKGVQEPVATLNTTASDIGREMEWIDLSATQGINAYYVVPCSEKGVKGTKDSIKVYVGEDVPGVVSNIQLALDGESVVVTWDAPIIGHNEGYLDPSKTKYTITRFPDNLQLAKDLTEKTFTDNNLNELQYYYYIIQATNNIGAGDSVQSESIMAGSSYTIPVELKFSSYSDSEIWTNLGRWYWSQGVQVGDEKMMVAVKEERDNWLISPSIKLEGGKRYRIKSTIKTDFGPNNCLYNFIFTIGKGKTGADQTTVLRDVKDYKVAQYFFINTFEDYVDITESGIYNYGINVTKIIGDDEFSFMGVSIEEVCNVDMAAVEMSNIFEAIYNTDNICNVTVKNNGKNVISDYKVQVARVTADGYAVLGEATEVQAIEPTNTAVIPITFRPNKEENMDIVGIVVAEGDGNATNDKTGIYSITVLPEGTMKFNRFVTGDGKDSHTRIPLSFKSDESTAQSLYLVNEIGAHKNCKIQRMAYEYTDNGISSVLGPVNVKIYMGNTDKQEYSSADEMIPVTDLKLVYDGETTINQGFNNMAFNLQEPFEYQKDKNLCITVVKNGLVGTDLPAIFNVFNYYEGSSIRTILLEKKSSMQKDVPVLHLATNEETGISRDITIGNSFVWYNPFNQTLNFTDIHIREVHIYDISGKVIANYSLSDNTTTLPVNIPLGLYIIRTLSTNGTMTNAKLNIMK